MEAGIERRDKLIERLNRSQGDHGGQLNKLRNEMNGYKQKWEMAAQVENTLKNQVKVLQDTVKATMDKLEAMAKVRNIP